MTNMKQYRIQFTNGHIVVEERESPNGTREAKCTLHPLYTPEGRYDGPPPYEPLITMLFREVVAWADENNYTHTKMLMRDGQPYFIAWVTPSQEEQQ